MAAISAEDFVGALQMLPGVSFRRVASTTERIVLDGTIYLDGGGLVPPLAGLCTLGVPWDVSWRIPRLVCHEPWLIDGGADWHVFDDGSLCLDLWARWRDHIGGIHKIYGRAAAAAYAAEYLHNSAQWLLNHHRYAYETGISIWPASWPAWAHFGRGPREYHRQRHAA